ncbi:MAG: ATP-dependent DNA helicase, partial [Candidatus Nanopelagicales bacterium]
ELEWKAIDVGTPFYAAEQGMLYVAADLPPPSRDGIQDVQLERLVDLIAANQGSALVLFSSWRALERAVEYVEQQGVIDRIQCSLFIQRRGDIVADLVSNFAEDTTSILFGTVSLWQGVDVPGESCSLVIIDRIPFPRPDDPLFAARTRHIEQHGGNGFMEVAVNRAALLMAQGSGRLIRSMTDQGMVAVLDSRLATARYREFILRSMPEFKRVADKDLALKFLSEKQMP